MRSSGGPRSVSTGTQASSGKSGTVSADARVPCESAKCSSETDRGSADPPKTASRGSANPHKMASKGSAAPSKSVPKGSAGPLKTAASKDDSSSSRRSPTKVRVDGVLVDVEGFSHPRHSTPSSRLQVPPKPNVPDRQSHYSPPTPPPTIFKCTCSPQAQSLRVHTPARLLKLPQALNLNHHKIQCLSLIHI